MKNSWRWSHINRHERLMSKSHLLSHGSAICLINSHSRRVTTGPIQNKLAIHRPTSWSILSFLGGSVCFLKTKDQRPFEYCTDLINYRRHGACAHFSILHRNKKRIVVWFCVQAAQVYLFTSSHCMVSWSGELEAEPNQNIPENTAWIFCVAALDLTLSHFLQHTTALYWANNNRPKTIPLHIR